MLDEMPCSGFFFKINFSFSCERERFRVQETNIRCLAQVLERLGELPVVKTVALLDGGVLERVQVVPASAAGDGEEDLDADSVTGADTVSHAGTAPPTGLQCPARLSTGARPWLNSLRKPTMTKLYRPLLQVSVRVPSVALLP